MKPLAWLFMALMIVSCAPETRPNITIVDGQNVLTLQPKSADPAALVAQAGLALSAADRLSVNGVELPAGASLSLDKPFTVQIHRAVDVTLITPDGQSAFQSAAATVGQAVAQHGLQLYAEDYLSPPAGTPLDGPLTVTYRPAQDLTIHVDGQDFVLKSAAQTVGKALAEAGIALLGLDYSKPAESEAVPANGQIKIVRVKETVLLQQNTLPYKTEYQTSDNLDLGSQEVLKAGQPGLSVSRVRVRTEDGKEVSRVTEAQTVVSQPQAQVIGLGTKVSLQAIPGSGGLKYWRAVSMYATWYSPCHSGTDKCMYGTASGLPVKRGVVAMVRANYNALALQEVYIPGYGRATIGDVGGGMPDRLWIDLAYADDDPGERLSGWVTVYFLTPVPADPTYVLQ
jgi:uncharacterized protein YabE (DUF348 family)